MFNKKCILKNIMNNKISETRNIYFVVFKASLPIYTIS